MSEQSSSKAKEPIDAARDAIEKLLTDKPNLRPQFVRIAFYDALSYNPATKADGPNASIRFWEGLASDADMKTAIRQLDDIKDENRSTFGPYVSYADLYQLAGTIAVAKANGPPIPFQHGRVVSYIPSKIPIITTDSPVEEVNNTFHRIGFTTKEIVALSWAYYYWMNYDPSSSPEQQLKFDNSYYKKLAEEIKASTPKPSSTTTSSATMGKQQSESNKSTTSFKYWKCLTSDASFHQHVQLFAENQKSFEEEYANAHKKLSELGFKHFPKAIGTEVEYQDMKHGIAFAVAMTILIGVVGFLYEVMRN